MPLLTLALHRGGAAAQFVVLPHRVGPGVRATSDDLEIAQLMGIAITGSTRSPWGSAMVVATIARASLASAPISIRHRSGAVIYAFERYHRGLGSLWGTLGRRVIIGLAQTSAPS